MEETNYQEIPRTEDGRVDAAEIIEPHTVLPREVTEEDIPRIIHDASRMMAACYVNHGKFGGALAVAHTQITKENPLKFFVTKDGLIVVNPEIVNHTKTPIKNLEGSISFPNKGIKQVERYNKVTVKFAALVNIDGEPKFEHGTENITRTASKVFQHAIDNLNGKYIYEIERGDSE